jgi:hypothetical protein
VAPLFAEPEPEPLAIVTVEDLENRAREVASDVAGPEAPDRDPGSGDYGGEHG